MDRARAELGKEWPFVVNGEALDRREVRGALADRLGHRDRSVLAGHGEGRGGRGRGREGLRPRVGADRLEGARVRILRNVADVMEDRLFDLAALMAFEVGKSRLEALGDVQETAELIRWNCDEVEKHDFRTPMSGLGAAGDYYDVMPLRRGAVISPFNFPFALAGGPSSGALVAGNAVVLKPSNQGALMGYKLYECYRDGGVPPGAFQL